jgi:hypothetical protein
MLLLHAEHADLAAQPQRGFCRPVMGAARYCVDVMV